ncbi:lysophosphatidic acid receptor 5-like [Hypanus sabinus]|uniref:lysophosphatidic acid receptor 5-like n=1 Tax=Hypanus sabinus TaxID=79690 RepID=UPI0028C4B356|nr:lysophosphatidic acid receptor 5-like [Hypanus sabinus]
MSAAHNWTTAAAPANATLPECANHDAVHRLHLAWNGTVLAAALPLNAAALWAFVGPLRLRTAVTVYLANLAACDLLFALSLPLRLHYYATGRWALGDVLCRLTGSLFQLNMYGSCLFLTAVNVDRYLALAYPLRSRAFNRRSVSWRVCGAVWALIALGSVPVAMVHDPSRCRRPGPGGGVQARCFEGFSDGTWRRELLPLVAVAEILGFLLPLAAVLYCSARVLEALWKGGGGQWKWRGKWRRKTVLLLVANALIFVVCFAPYNLVLAFYALARSNLLQLSPVSEKALRMTLQVTVLLSGTNCCLDPLVYYYSTEGFRATFRGRAAAATGALSAPTSRARSHHTEASRMVRLEPARERRGESVV